VRQFAASSPRFRLLAGALGAILIGGLREGQLFEVGSRDPIAIGSVIAMMVAAALVAGILPARGAARINPSRALHEG
jgi:ABC-type antimicrobial peptide transport system permease subunit